MNPEDKKEILRILFNTIDPAGVFSDHNFDEYDPEINEFLSTLVDIDSEEEVHKTLTAIFNKFFDGVNFNREKIRILANRIYSETYTVHEIGSYGADKTMTERVTSDLGITFDGVRTNYIFDYAAFVASIDKDGVFPIVVCTCQHIACAGMYVRVLHKGKYVYWTEFYHGQADTFSRRRSY